MKKRYIILLIVFILLFLYFGNFILVITHMIYRDWLPSATPISKKINLDENYYIRVKGKITKVNIKINSKKNELNILGDFDIQGIKAYTKLSPDKVIFWIEDYSIIYDFKNNKIIKKLKEINIKTLQKQSIERIYGYFEDKELFLVLSGSNLGLYDLDFNEVKLITENALQWDNKVIDSTRLIYEERIVLDEKEEDGRNKVVRKYFLYDTNTNTKKELSHIKKYCDSIIGYKKNTNQIMCRDHPDELVLIDLLEDKNMEVHKIPLGVLYLDEENDIMFVNCSYLSMPFGEQPAENDYFYYYDFKNKELHKLVNKSISIGYMNKIREPQ